MKQRNSLLKQMGFKPDETQLATLDVWDKRLGEAAEDLLAARLDLLEKLQPYVLAEYKELAGEDEVIAVEYLKSWEGQLFDTLIETRQDDMRRSVTTHGTHRDDLSVTINGFDSRNEVSQGEQRTLSLALRLAGHRLLTDVLGEPPLLLLDDVLSELDNDRAVALLDHLPEGQTIITSAVDLPDAIQPEQLITSEQISPHVIPDGTRSFSTFQSHRVAKQLQARGATPEAVIPDGAEGEDPGPRPEPADE